MSARKRARRLSASTTTTHTPISDLVHDKFTLVRIDAPPHVEIREGVYVTVQGQVSGLKQAAQQLANPRPRPHSLPDIVFLPSSTSVLALDDVVGAKPHVLVRSEDLDKARALQHGGNAGSSSRSYPHAHALTPGATSMGAASTIDVPGTVGMIGTVGGVGVLTPPPLSKRVRKSSVGIHSGLLDAADVMSQEDREQDARKGKLSPRSLTFDESGGEEREKGAEIVDGSFEGVVEAMVGKVKQEACVEDMGTEDPTPQSKTKRAKPEDERSM